MVENYTRRIEQLTKFHFNWDKRKNKLEQIREQSKKCIDFYNLKYTFKLDNAKVRVGQCDYGKKTISISKYYCELNDYSEIECTIIHEVAHAISFELFGEYGHGVIWQKVDKQLGNTGDRCYDVKKVNMPKGKYKYVCLTCNFVHHFHRKVKRLHACPKCCEKYNNGKFSIDYLLFLEEKSGNSVKITKTI